ncbi:MAG: hypothetical protein JW863_19355 [Chitinispirillaceae bacterium]|nr:hypothetical protein [Chitinispirillaceae bacterium]
MYSSTYLRYCSTIALKLVLLLFAGSIAARADKLTVDTAPWDFHKNSRLPYRFIFSEKMIPLGFQRDSVPVGLSIEPALAGKWQWASQSTLQFSPDSDWCIGNRYTFLIPEDICSKISGTCLSKKVKKSLQLGELNAQVLNAGTILSNVDPIQLYFSLEVIADSVRKYLSGVPEPYTLTTGDEHYYSIRPENGWPAGEKIHLFIDTRLTPRGGTIRLTPALSEHFTVSDTLFCTGLFRNEKEVSPADTLFLEDDYVLRFNRSLHRDAFRDYFTVNGKMPDEVDIRDTEIRINRYLVPLQPCTLMLGAGMPSRDSAFLFKDRRFILVGDNNRVDPDMPSFSIKGIEVRYAPEDSMSSTELSPAVPVELTPDMKFIFLTRGKNDVATQRRRGQAYCITAAGVDTLRSSGSSDVHLQFRIDPFQLPVNSCCTLIVKAGYVFNGRQLKRDFIAPFRTGRFLIPPDCKPVLGKRYRSYFYRRHHRNQRYLFLPGVESVPLERYGKARVVTAIRNISAAEQRARNDSTFIPSGKWYTDTIPPPEKAVDWYEYLPLPLTPVLSSQRRGSAEVLYAVNDTSFDTIGQVTVTDLGVQLLNGRLATAVIVTSLTERTPVAGTEVELYGTDGTVLDRGTTDTAGLALFGGTFNPEFIQVAVPGDTLVEHFSGYRFSDSVPGERFLITDRTLYHPGDTVYFKGIVRRLLDRWEPARGDSAIVSIDWKDGKTFIDTFVLTGCGWFSGIVVIPENVQFREFEISVNPMHTKCRQWLHKTFSVAAFRPVELAGIIESGYIAGDSIHFPLYVRWLHGGTAGACPVEWKCTYRENREYPYGFLRNGKDVKDRFWEHSDTITLDTSGRAGIAIRRLPDDSGGSYILKVVFNGSSVQSASARNYLRIPRSSRLRLRQRGAVMFNNRDTTFFKFTATRENREPVYNLLLNAGIVRHDTVRTTVKNRYGLPAVIRKIKDRRIGGIQAVTDSLGYGTFHVPPLESGRYTLTVQPEGFAPTDSFTYAFEVKRRSSYTGKSRRDNDSPSDTFTITKLDTCMHAVGDTVHLRLHSSRDSCMIAVTVRRENIYRFDWIQMQGRDTIITLPIEDRFIPEVKVAASCRLPLRKWDKGFTFDQPQTVINATETVEVAAESRRIPVAVHTDRSEYAPGDSATVRLSVPAEFASATALVMVVDEGILRRSGNHSSDIFTRFSRASQATGLYNDVAFFRSVHGTFNYDSSNQLYLRPHRLGISGIGYGGGYGSGFGGSGSGGIDDLIGGLMGADGGGGLEFTPSKKGMIRNPPRPCACFNPKVTFDTEGKAICRFLLPGNLTRWRVTAIVDDTTAFGSDTTSFTAQKDLMVRPQLPRFLRRGDSAAAVYIVENRSGRSGTVFSGVAVAGDTITDTCELSSEGVRQVSFPLRGRSEGTDSLLFMARNDTLFDAIRLAVPVISERTRNVEAVSGTTTESVVIPVLLPETGTNDSGTLAMNLSTTRMRNCEEGVGYLFGYPYGCLEQRSSKILPLLVLGDFMRRFNLPMLDGGDEREVVRKYLDNIVSFQNKDDGGLGYWPTDTGRSSPWLTAYVLEVMERAKDASYSVNETVFYRALGYLRSSLRSKKDTSGRQAYLDSYMQLILAATGKPDRAALRKLYVHKDNLPLSARVNLLRAMHVAGGFRWKVRSLQKGLRRRLVEKDRLAYFSYEKSDEFSSCHESPVRQTALTLEALLETGTRSRFDEPLIRWLLEQRRNGRWRNTQENMAVFRAFAAYTRIYEFDNPDIDVTGVLGKSNWFKVTLQGRNEVGFTAEKPLDSIPSGGNTDVLLHCTGTGRLYYDLMLTTFPKAPGPKVANGLSIVRTAIPVDEKGSSLQSREFHTGQLLKVTLTIRCDQHLTFVAINDPVPAGCEAINPDLNGAHRETADRMTGWRGPGGLSHREFRDSRVLCFADAMPTGEYRFSYLMKTTTAGRFQWPAPVAEAMYYPEFFGRGEAGWMSIYERSGNSGPSSKKK